jgi:hypothetical protein
MTILPPSATRRARCARPSPPRESSPARIDPLPTRSRARASQPGCSVDATLVMPAAASSATAASRRTRLSTLTPFSAPKRDRRRPTAPLAVLNEPVAALKAKVGQHYLGAEGHGNELMSHRQCHQARGMCASHRPGNSRPRSAGRRSRAARLGGSRPRRQVPQRRRVPPYRVSVA